VPFGLGLPLVPCLRRWSRDSPERGSNYRCVSSMEASICPLSPSAGQRKHHAEQATPPKNRAFSRGASWQDSLIAILCGTTLLLAASRVVELPLVPWASTPQMTDNPTPESRPTSAAVEGSTVPGAVSALERQRPFPGWTVPFVSGTVFASSRTIRCIAAFAPARISLSGSDSANRSSRGTAVRASGPISPSATTAA